MIHALMLTLALAAPPDATRLPEPHRPLARQVLGELIAIDSTHAHGAATAAEAIRQRLLAAGWPEPDLTLAGPDPTHQNLIVRFRGTGMSEPILWVLHLDVVEAHRDDWSMDPFTLVERDGFFYGRGTIDMKGDVAAQVVALLRLRQEGFRPARDLVFAFTDGEEAGGVNGVEWLLKHRPELIRATYAINPDGGGGDAKGGKRLVLALQTSEKVFQTFRLEATDRGGHSSAPHPGNPIYRLAGALERISHLEFPIRLGETVRGYFAATAMQEQGALAADLAALGRLPTDAAAAARVARASDAYAALLQTTCVATEVSGGHAEAALPQRARATVNCRALPDDRLEEVEAALRRAVADPEVAITRDQPGPGGPPSPLLPEVVNATTEVMEALFPGVRLAPSLSNGASDSAHLRGAGVPSYGVSGIFTDVDDLRSHGRDERVRVVDFYDGVEFAYRLTRRLGVGR
jgi:acetylornithine deacetylase/succinyl-diaminopimelate desuccinylase-like protein